MICSTMTTEIAWRSTEKGGQLRKAAKVLVELIEKQGVAIPIIDAEVEKEDNVFPLIPAGAGMKDRTRLFLT